MSTHNDWWGELRHGGLLLTRPLLDELLPDLPPLDPYAYDRLRVAWLKWDAALRAPGDPGPARREWVTRLVEDFLGLNEGWKRASAVPDSLKTTTAAGERLRPDWALYDGDDPLLLVSFDDADRLGVGRSRRSHARLVELLRATGVPLGLLTNGRQLRLVHAGPDFDAWAEWDVDTWFDEGEGRETLRGLRALAGARADGHTAALRALAAEIRHARSRQGDLAQVLGEQVRRAVELLLDEADATLDQRADLRAALLTDPASGARLREEDALAALYQAATRVVMRLVLILYAEARDLLPASVEAYHESYGVESLYRTLTRARGAGADADPHAAAWLRLLALFRLIYFGSPHPDLPVRAYGGQLFAPGDASSPDPALRALAVLEAARPDTVLVANADDARVMARARGFAGRTITFGMAPSADVRASGVQMLGLDGVRATVETPAGRFDLHSPLLGAGNLMNVLAATAVAVDFKVPLDDIAACAASLRPAYHRGELLRLRQGVRVIDDSYNSSPAALKRSLEVLAAAGGRTRKIAVLGEMLELGAHAEALHRECGRAARAAGVDLLITVGGAPAGALADEARAAGMAADHVLFVPDRERATEVLLERVRPGDLVLVKGSRGIGLDAVVERLKAEWA